MSRISVILSSPRHLLAASAGLAAGAKSYTLELVDVAGNVRIPAPSFSATVAENVPFAGNGFDTANGTGSSGKPEKGDTVTFAFDHAPDPYSILSDWSGGAAASVTVSIADNSSNDTLSVAGTNLGSVALKGDYVSKTVSFSSSSMVLSGNSIAIVLGTPSSSALEEKTKHAPVWSPSSSAYDLVGNACSTVAFTATSERQF
jgi:hypothetical protein